MPVGFCQRPESRGNREENAERTGRGQQRAVNHIYIALESPFKGEVRRPVIPR